MIGKFSLRIVPDQTPQEIEGLVIKFMNDEFAKLHTNHIRLLGDVYGINGLKENPRVLSLVNQIDKSGDGSVQIHEFIYACKRYQLILKPAFSACEIE